MKQYCAVNLLFVCFFSFTLQWGSNVFHLPIKPYSVKILCKATEQYCSVVLFTIQWGSNVFHLRIKPCSVTIVWKATGIVLLRSVQF